VCRASGDAAAVEGAGDWGKDINSGVELKRFTGDGSAW